MGLYITNPIQIRPAILQDAEGISRGFGRYHRVVVQRPRL